MCSEVVEDSDSAVPVVRLDNNNILVGRQDDVTGRCAADDNKEIAPDLHVIGNIRRESINQSMVYFVLQPKAGLTHSNTVK